MCHNIGCCHYRSAAVEIKVEEIEDAALQIDDFRQMNSAVLISKS